MQLMEFFKPNRNKVFLAMFLFFLSMVLVSAFDEKNSFNVLIIAIEIVFAYLLACVVSKLSLKK